MSKVLFIVGAGSVGGHVASNISLYNLKYDSIYFIDDDPQKKGLDFVGYPILDNVGYLETIKEVADVVVGIAFPKTKKKIIEKLKKNTWLRFPTLVASNAWISNDVQVGEGCIIYPNCSINYGSELKDFVVMNMNCALGHHAYVDSYSSLAPGVNFGGHTKLGLAVDMGIGACTLQNVTIGDNSVVGGQAMVINNVAENSIVKGIPAKQ